MKNLIKCDKCGKIMSEKEKFAHLSNWQKGGSDFVEKELCPDCYKEYKEMLDKFINK